MRALIIGCLVAWCATAAASVDLMTQIATQARQSPVLRADFVQTKTMAALKRPLVSTGRMLLSSTHGVAWLIETPVRAGYVISEQRLTEIDAQGMPRAREASDVPGLAQISRTFQAMMSGDLDALRDTFEVSVTGTPTRWDMVLRPRQRQTAAFIASLQLSGGRHVDRVAIVEANGDTTTLQMKNTLADATLKADEAALFLTPARR